MNFQYNKNIILNILDKKPNLGKTAIMKIIFMLQQVKKMNLKYDFEIYTYGPYSSEVTEDVESLIQNQLVDSSMYLYNNYVGYRLSISENGRSALSVLDESDENKINEILYFVEGKTAKDLELYSTIIYVNNLYVKNSWVEQDVISNVHEIKPHFSYVKISDAYHKLKKENYI
jgi:hypothetical protein